MSQKLSLHLSAKVAPHHRLNAADVAQLKLFLKAHEFYEFGDAMVSKAEPALFDAIAKFQAGAGVPVTDEVEPGDKTHQAMKDWINPVAVAKRAAEREAGAGRLAFASSSIQTGKYIWRTKSDSKVRSRHADRDGEVFSWDNPPKGGHPGEDYNCRCRAEPIAVPISKPTLIPISASGREIVASSCIEERLDLTKTVEKRRIKGGELSEVERLIHNLSEEITQDEEKLVGLNGREGRMSWAAVLGGPFLGTIAAIRAKVLEDDIRELEAVIGKKHEAMKALEDQRAELEPQVQSLEKQEKAGRWAYEQCTAKQSGLDAGVA